MQAQFLQTRLTQNAIWRKNIDSSLLVTFAAAVTLLVLFIILASQGQRTREISIAFATLGAGALFSFIIGGIRLYRNHSHLQFVLAQNGQPLTDEDLINMNSPEEFVVIRTYPLDNLKAFILKAAMKVRNQDDCKTMAPRLKQNPLFKIAKRQLLSEYTDDILAKLKQFFTWLA